MVVEGLQEKLLRIKEMRGVSWAQLARDIGVSYITLYGFMRYKREPAFRTVMKITHYLELQREFLNRKGIEI